jgi:SAM-dependent methyltransferase
MSDGADIDFYAAYGRFKDYATPGLKAKHIRRFDELFWKPAVCAPHMAVLEVGCGLGQFLLYLKAKGVADFLGFDQDPGLAAHIPEAVRGHFRVADVWGFLADRDDGRTFDRIVLFDVLEHFAPADGARLLAGLAARLRPGGRLVVKVPNAASPWGAQHQFGDLTHKAAYTPKSLRQLALAAGLDCLVSLGDEAGSPRRRLTDRLVHRLLSALLASPPPIWSANFVAVLGRPDEGRP